MACQPIYAVSGQSAYRYVINLDNSTKKKAIRLGGVAHGLSVYRVKTGKAGAVKYRTRLGFFKSRKNALAVLAKIKSRYPKAWLDTVKQYDYRKQDKWLAANLKTRDKKSFSAASLLMSRSESAKLMETARKQVVLGKYAKAIKLYTKLISRGHPEFRRDALEFLGATREKNGQYAHAKAEYQEYLRLYPKTEGAERVRMRLQSMLLAQSKPRRKLKKARSGQKTWWDTYGYFTEFYRYDKLQVNQTPIEKSSSASSLGLFARRRSESSDLKLQMTGDYLYDFDNTDDNRSRLTSLYIDYANRPKTTSIRLGRQNHTRSGVLGRMDGVWADYQFHPQWKFNVVAGYPVNLFETNNIQYNRKFYGYSLDIGPFYKYWDFNLFRIEQEVDGVTDREALGGEIRFVSPGMIFFTLLDYDTYYEEMNKIYFVATMRFKGQTTVNFTFDKGKSPYMLTTNALQGQPYRSIAEMQTAFTDSEIKQIARDRTADLTTSSVSLTTPLNKDYSFNANISISNVSATPDSAGVAGTQSTGDEYFYVTQLIGNNILSKNDTMILGIRYSDTSSYSRTSYSFNERMFLGKKWRTNFGLYYDLTDNINGAKTKAIKPMTGLDYIYSKSLRLEADLAYEKSSTHGDTLPTETEGLSFNAGLIYSF